SLLHHAHVSLSVLFFFPSRRRHTSFSRDWSSDVSLPICTSDRRADRQQPVLDVGLVLADDLILRGLAALDVDEMHRRTEHDAAVRVELSDVDDLRIRELRFDIANARLDQSLLLLGGVILRILAQVAVCARLRDRVHYPGPLLVLQPPQLLSELLRPARRQWHLAQVAVSSCRSCNRLTMTLSR